MTYTRERKAFAHLRDNCEDEVAAEYAAAVRTVLEQYSTTIYENRFVTGGAMVCSTPVQDDELIQCRTRETNRSKEADAFLASL